MENNHIDRIDPSRAPTKTALKLVGFLGVSAGFMLAYQRSSCECSSCCSQGCCAVGLEDVIDWRKGMDDAEDKLGEDG